MAAVLTRVLAPARNRFLRQSSTNTNTGNINDKGFEHNAQSQDVTMADVEEVDNEDAVAEEAACDEEDIDAEGEPDEEATPPIELPEPAEDDDEYEEEEVAQKARRRSGRSTRQKRSESLEDDAEVDEDADSDSDEEEEELQLDDESEANDEQAAESEPHNPNLCVFCGQSEENDPGEDFEEYLACAACGDNAHQSCARDEETLQADQGQPKQVRYLTHQYIPNRSTSETASWKCPDCVEQGVEKVTTAERARRRSSSKLTRELEPVMKDGAHSVFTNVVFEDDVNGSRSLRKRKGSTESMEDRPHLMRKRRKREVSETIIEEQEDGEEGAESSRPSRLRQQRKSTGSAFRVVQKDDDHFIVAFGLRANLQDLEHEWKKARRRERDRARRARQAQVVVTQEPDIPHFPSISLNFTAPVFPSQDREGEEAKKLYGGILSEIEADTTRTFPQSADRKKFEDARQKAEEEWKKKIDAARAADPSKPAPKVSGPPSRIKCINFGKFEVDTWHAAPYPEEYSRNRVLYICEFCLKYMSSDFVAWRHKLKCPAKHPPGDEIYRDGNFSFFEVDGRKNPVYCQNLCLLAKLFLGSKTLYYDVEPFLFYVMTEHDEYGEHFVGYFSKEKRPSSLNNVSCILVLPVHQRRGFGHMLIEFSYLLTKVEQKTGSPEKPLSDMGLVSYRSYWRLILCKELLALHAEKTPISITELSSKTGMTADDIVCGLEGLRALVRDPITKTYALRLDLPYYRQYIDNYESKGYTKINPDALVWVPYVMGRDNMHYENAPQLTTVKQREDPEDTTAAFEEAGPLEEGVQQSQGFEQAEADIVAAENTTTDPSGGAALDDGPPIDPALLALDSGPSMPAPLPNNNSKSPSTHRGQHNNMPESIVHPFPSLDLETPSKPRSPPKHVVPNTPALPNDRTYSPIPPARYEVFPPLPGMGPKKKLGRPLGRGARARLAAGLGVVTPVRRGGSARGSPAPMHQTPAVNGHGGANGNGNGSITVRRTRSSLAEGDMSVQKKALRRGRSMLAADVVDKGAEQLHTKDESAEANDVDVDMEMGDANEDDEDADAEGEADIEMEE